MEDLYKNSIDVVWSCADWHGTPVLVIQADGPVLSAQFCGAVITDIQTRFILDLEKLPEAVPTTFLCMNGMDVLNPLLACDIEPMLTPVVSAIEKNERWLLTLQFVIEGQRNMRMFLIKGNTTTPIVQDGASVFPRWLVEITER